MPEERPEVLVVGAGGLGAPLLLALAESGRPLSITLLDDDLVELSNLPRQLLHGDATLGQRKADSALRALARFPHLRVAAHGERLGTGNAARWLAGRDLILDGSDSLETKFLVNDEAVRRGVPAVIAGVVRFVGQIVSLWPGRAGGCYRCLFEEAPRGGDALTCQQAGVLGPACGVVGALQAREALRLLDGRPPERALLTLDLWRPRARRVALPRRGDCLACSGIYR